MHAAASGPFFGSRLVRLTYKPGSVRRRSAPTVIPLGVRSLAPSSSLPAASLSKWAPLAAYLALLRLGFTLPRLLPAARWALTPPFHPYPHRITPARRRCVFCGTIRRHGTASGVATPRRYLAACPWSPDFPRSSVSGTPRRDRPAKRARISISEALDYPS